MNAISLFAGVGGFDLACERAGVTVTAAVEINKAARRTLGRHFRFTTLYEDVARVHAADTCRGCDDCLPAGRPDLVCAGFPCQDLSVAGRRAGLAGLRSGLFYELARIISETTPRWVVLENVPGLLSSNDGRDMAAVVGTLGDLGYGWAYRVLDAQFFGVPQRRRRVFVVGHLGNRAAPAQVLLEPESSGRDSRPCHPAGQTVAGTLGGGSGSRGWAPDTDRMTFLPVTFRKAARAQDNQDDESWVPDVVTNTLNTHDVGDVRTTDIVAFAWQAGGKNSASGAFNDDGTTPTLPVSQTLAVTDGVAVRRLTPLECERLEGFPDGWTEGQADGPRYKQMGNAVAVPVVEWLVRRLVAVDTGVVSLGADIGHVPGNLPVLHQHGQGVQEVAAEAAVADLAGDDTGLRPERIGDADVA